MGTFFAVCGRCIVTSGKDEDRLSVADFARVSFLACPNIATYKLGEGLMVSGNWGTSYWPGPLKVFCDKKCNSIRVFLKN